MKMKRGIFFWGWAICSAQAIAIQWLSPAPVIKVTLKSPLFSKASAQSENLGIADPDTPILARALSPNGSWLLVEDSDSNRAWMPTDRSNYSLVRASSDEFLPPLSMEAPGTRVDPNSLKANAEEVIAPIPPMPEEKITTYSSPKNYELGAAWAYSFVGRDDSHKSRWPFSLGYLEGAGTGERMGLRLSYEHWTRRVWQVNFVARFPWGARGMFFREFEAGYERQWDQGSSQRHSALNLAYSAGIYFTPALSLSIRGGFFGSGKSQWNGGVFLRCFVY